MSKNETISEAEAEDQVRIAAIRAAGEAAGFLGPIDKFHNLIDYRRCVSVVDGVAYGAADAVAAIEKRYPDAFGESPRAGTPPARRSDQILVGSPRPSRQPRSAAEAAVIVDRTAVRMSTGYRQRM